MPTPKKKIIKTAKGPTKPSWPKRYPTTKTPINKDSPTRPDNR